MQTPEEMGEGYIEHEQRGEAGDGRYGTKDDGNKGEKRNRWREQDGKVREIK